MRMPQRRQRAISNRRGLNPERGSGQKGITRFLVPFDAAMKAEVPISKEKTTSSSIAPPRDRQASEKNHVNITKATMELSQPLTHQGKISRWESRTESFATFIAGHVP